MSGVPMSHLPGSDVDNIENVYAESGLSDDLSGDNGTGENGETTQSSGGSSLLGTGNTGSGDTSIQTGETENLGVQSGSDLSKKQYKISPNGSKPTYRAFANMEEWRDRTIYQAPANTYSMTVATGASAGEKVLYFAIKYKDVSGVTRQQFLFPHVDAFEKSKDLLNYYCNRTQTVQELNPNPKDGIYTYYFEITDEEQSQWRYSIAKGKLGVATINGVTYGYTRYDVDIPSNKNVAKV